MLTPFLLLFWGGYPPSPLPDRKINGYKQLRGIHAGQNIDSMRLIAKIWIPIRLSYRKVWVQRSLSPISAEEFGELSCKWLKNFDLTIARAASPEVRGGKVLAVWGMRMVSGSFAALSDCLF